MNIAARTIAVCSLTLLTLAAMPDTAFSAPKDGDYYYQQAQAEEAQNGYAKAKKYFKKAAARYSKEANAAQLALAKNDWFRMECLLGEYSLTEGKLRSLIRKSYPWAAKAQVEGWIANQVLLSMPMDKGKLRYFSGEIDNLHYRNPEIMDGMIEHNPGQAGTDAFIQALLDDYVNADYTDFALPYDRPLDILMDFQLRIKRSQLPKNGDGVVRVWMPTPINTGCQHGIQLLSLEPQGHLVGPPNVDADIGLAYFEIPVAEVKRDLVIRSQVRFLHDQQRFEIDPESLDPYDQDGEPYLTYTASSANIQVTPEITAHALAIVGAETNPYRRAKLIYEHIVANVNYSFTPHGTLQALPQAESDFVHEHQFGDCGAQSMYFSALCRSLGIPARTCGGYQTFNRTAPGTHFWAEFYVPAPYDQWLPVDPTAAELWKIVRGFPDIDMENFRQYFFGQQDPLRMVIQNDVDLPLAPLPPDPQEGAYFQLVVQDPVVIYAGATTLPLKIETYQYCALDFNFDQAHVLVPGAAFDLDAADFGLPGGTFPKDAKIVLVDRHLGKTVSLAVPIQGDPDGQATITCALPEEAQAIAYALHLTSRTAGNVQSARYVIVQAP
jgi:tetratricopeptide (TPR) repeat protein